MKNKLIILISLFILLFAFSVSGVTLLSTGFDYNSTYASAGWSFTRTTGNFSDHPIYSPDLNSNAFGDISQDTGGGASTDIVLGTSLPIQNGTYRISGLVVWNVSKQTYTDTIKIRFVNSSGISPISIIFSKSSINVTNYPSLSSTIGLCNYAETEPYKVSFIMTLNFDTNQVNFTLTDLISESVVYTCSNTFSLAYGGNRLSSFQLNHGIAQNDNISRFLDDLQVEWISVSNLYDTNSYCSEDTNCFTGYCINNKCQYKTENMDCSNNYECLSGSCINSKCTKPDMALQLSNYWTGAGIVSTGSKLLIGFLIMLILTIVVAVLTGANPIASSVTALASLFLVVYLGLFPLWIVVLIVIVCGIGFFTFFANKG